LFVGNSLTHHRDAPETPEPALHDLPELLARMARARGARVEPGRVTAPGAVLEEHRLGPRLEPALRAGWDLVVLQESSERALVSEDFFAEARLLDARIKAAGAKTALFGVWTPRALAAEAPALERSLVELSAELGALLVPVGAAWRAASEARPELKLYREDGVHPAPAGAYLSASVFYARLLGAGLDDARAASADLEAVRDLSAGPAPSAADLAFLRGLAAGA
jgi:hypothetical protein